MFSNIPVLPLGTQLEGTASFLFEVKHGCMTSLGQWKVLCIILCGNFLEPLPCLPHFFPCLGDHGSNVKMDFPA